ncbi:MAG: DUF6600 domain-containing protein [Candidatus Aminicenantales bacterium]
MKYGAIRSAVFGAILLAVAAGLVAADNYKVVNGPKDYYFGHISYIEPTPDGTDPVVLREGGSSPEPGILNLPVGPGDTIRTSGDRRCEIQFDTGTIIRLDVATEVRIETILARSLSGSDELSVLTLGKGRIYVMYREYGRKEMFQVLTPNAAVKMKHTAVAILTAASDGTTEAQVNSGRAQVLFGPDEKRLDDRVVRKGERLIVLANHQFELAAAVEGTAFELWNLEVNAHFDELHAGLTALPKPIQRLPEAVFYFAQTYGNHYGEWLWDELYGYVWRPYIDNGAYPWGWSPYYYGSWSYSGGQMFWVPQEPWGWIPYHLGVWQWDKKLGWVWLPGSMFAPAWADWEFFFGYASWRPWSLFDWMSNNPYGASNFGYLGDELISGPYWSDGISPAVRPTRTVVTKNALKQPSAGSLPIPAELKGVVKKVTSAYEQGDARIRDGAAAVPRQLIIVAKGDLASRAINEKALTLDQVAKRGALPAAATEAPPRIADPRREAARIFRGLEGPAAAPRRIVAPDMTPIRSGNMTAVPVGPAGRADGSGTSPGRAVPPSARFRDWNPDLRIARELGVHIEYSSLRNEVRCPELKLSSRDRERAVGMAPRLTSAGVGYGRAASFDGQTADGSSPSGATAPASSTSTRGQSERTSSSSGSKESKSGGGSAKIKN